MSLVDQNKIKALASAGQALTDMQKPITVAQTEGDWLSKVERIVSGVNSMAENFAKLRNSGIESPEPHNRMLLDSPRREPAPEIHRTVEQAAPSANETRSKEMKSKAIKSVLAKVEEYLDTCIEKDPNMAIGQAIQQAPLNVTQVRGLLELLKMVI